VLHYGGRLIALSNFTFCEQKNLHIPYVHLTLNGALGAKGNSLFPFFPAVNKVILKDSNCHNHYNPHFFFIHFSLFMQIDITKNEFLSPFIFFVNNNHKLLHLSITGEMKGICQKKSG
jgi:hypothetical protein